MTNGKMRAFRNTTYGIVAQEHQQMIKNSIAGNSGPAESTVEFHLVNATSTDCSDTLPWTIYGDESVPRERPLENDMAQYTYYLFDTGVRMVHSETIKHVDNLDALERMRLLLDDFADIEMVQLWQHENYIGHITRSEGRLILKRQSDPMPVHPLLGIVPATQATRETKAS